jgi:hypothetical protein
MPKCDHNVAAAFRLRLPDEMIQRRLKPAATAIFDGNLVQVMIARKPGK